jgi:hypothetical protein
MRVNNQNMEEVLGDLCFDKQIKTTAEGLLVEYCNPLGLQFPSQQRLNTALSQLHHDSEVLNELLPIWNFKVLSSNTFFDLILLIPRVSVNAKYGMLVLTFEFLLPSTFLTWILLNILHFL